MPPHWGKYIKEIGIVHKIIMTPIREIPVCVGHFWEPENSSSCVTTAPTVPPLPVIPDITPIDLPKNHTHIYLFPLAGESMCIYKIQTGCLFRIRPLLTLFCLQCIGDEKSLLKCVARELMVNFRIRQYIQMKLLYNLLISDIKLLVKDMDSVCMYILLNY